MFWEIHHIISQADTFTKFRNSVGDGPINMRREDFPYTTLAGQFAYENDHLKVEWLRQLGASPADIIHGYALVGNHKQVENYRATHQVDVNDIVLAYALAGNHEQVEHYRRVHDASVHATATGYAHAGNHDYVEHYRRVHDASVHAIAMGYALAGNHRRVDYYRMAFGARLDSIIHGYALAANFELIEQYGRDHGIDYAALGYAIAGNHEQVEYYRTNHGVRANVIAEGYAMAGNHERVEYYRRVHSVSSYAIATGYAAVGNAEKNSAYRLRFLLERYISQRREQVTASGEIKPYLHGSFFPGIQKSYDEKNNAVNALLSALNDENVDVVSHLPALRNGELKTQLRLFIKLGYAEQLVHERVDTVNDFVHAYQNKIREEHHVGASVKRAR